MMSALAQLSYDTEACNDSGQGDDAAAIGRDGAARRALRDALGQFATGVTVVTAAGADGRAVGVTINAFASVSLAPPLLLWCLARSSGSLPVLRAAPCHAINVLGSDQLEVCRRFAARGDDRFAGIAHRSGPCGTVLIDGTLAYFICRHRSVRAVGDHVLFVVEVVAYGASPGTPLVFHGGAFADARCGRESRAG
ncbi:flavin reductase family protein [Cupriavidus taiwanensis]|uniref:flavin reductase family protein n=1 Tax=Cupriavidus taiwanensis TaxID=164546 RepID=UPI000E1820CA|nr:flavin reductase family protein [Cupriavidus taiwanensis]SPC16653.1 putative flavin:NAD reductase [Cupriavidus taiwanensis]